MVTAIDLSDPPRHLRAGPVLGDDGKPLAEQPPGVDVSARYGITPRLAGEWIRRMIAAGAIAKVGRVPVGRLSATDAWVASGGQSLRRSRAVRP